MLNVYVASFYANAPFVRKVHGTLSTYEIRATSEWAREAHGPEDFSTMTPEKLRAVAEANDRDLREADVILVIDPDGKGRETYAELRLALEWGKPAVFFGKPNLSAWRKGVVRVTDIITALAVLVDMGKNHDRGARGFDLLRGIDLQGAA